MTAANLALEDQTRIAPAGAAPLIDVSALSIGFGASPADAPVVRDVSFELHKGRVLALIGESGSGKTLAARSVMGLLPKGARVFSGAIEFEGQDLLKVSDASLRRLRGARIGMILQEPMVSLNPSMTIGDQLVEGLKLHENPGDEACRIRAIEMLEKVGVSAPDQRLKQYPHEFSGGMRQRIMIASIMLLRPEIVIADEPTTALDAIIQRDVMELILELTREIGAAVLLITHDLGVVADYADDVAVMRKGEIVERGPAAETLAQPTHPYTVSLLEALPSGDGSISSRSKRGEPVVTFKDVKISFSLGKKWPWSHQEKFKAVHGVSFDIARGEVTAVVGESGSGKTTLGRALLGLLKPSAGHIDFDGADVGAQYKRPYNHLHDRVQLIFQDPYSSLNPRLKVAEIVTEAIRKKIPDPAARHERAILVLMECGLSEDFANRYPHQLSGGQRQRVCVARALANDPEMVVADEPVAALDLTVQAQILKLMKSLQGDRGFSMMFISHDLAVVEQIADRIIVMQKGWIVEMGAAAALFQDAQHPYTQALLQASPYLQVDDETGRYQLKTRRLKPASPGNGVTFFNSEQAETAPVMQQVAPDHWVAVS